MFERLRISLDKYAPIPDSAAARSGEKSSVLHPHLQVAANVALPTLGAELLVAARTAAITLILTRKLQFSPLKITLLGPIK